MSDVNGAGNTVINNYYDSEGSSGADNQTDTGTDNAPDSISSDALQQYLERALEDGNLSDTEAKVAEGLAGLEEGTGGTDGGSDTDETDSGSSSDLTPQDFLSQLNDIADEEKGLTDGEKEMLETGKSLVGESPEKQQAYLDKANELAEDGEISDEDAAELKGFAEGLKNGESGESGGSEEMSEEEFMEQVDDLLAQSQGGAEGPGEQMAREGAELVKDNSTEDKEAYLAELDKMLNNTDGNGDYEKDIDETNDGEGSMLKNMAEAFEEPHRGDGTEGGDSGDFSGSGSTGGSESSNDIVGFIRGISADDEITDEELAGLRELVNA